MNLAIVGNGRLGKAVSKAWEEAGGKVVARIGKGDKLQPLNWGADIVLESSTPFTAFHNATICIKAGLPVVIGTTGWHDKMDELIECVNENNGYVFHATNFSIGVHLMNKLACMMTKSLDKFPQYTPSISETHHIHKLDKPSGTALTLAAEVEEAGGLANLNIESIREGEVIGNHELIWESDVDKLVLTHEAKSRLGFARGAALAASWLIEAKKNSASGVYTMNDMITDL
jgi:4-hydroxy-tetrahydrodipicolinate reductase